MPKPISDLQPSSAKLAEIHAQVRSLGLDPAKTQIVHSGWESPTAMIDAQGRIVSVHEPRFAVIVGAKRR
jgi:hypothetical protein